MENRDGSDFSRGGFNGYIPDELGSVIKIAPVPIFSHAAMAEGDQPVERVFRVGLVVGP